MHTIALPDSTAKDLARRSITHRWLRPDVTPWEDDATRAVELHISHDKDRREYHAALSLVEVHHGFISTRIARGHYLTISRRSTARYSAKAFEDFAAEALLVLAHTRAINENAATLFAGQPY